jgi:hypothetical protein
MAEQQTLYSFTNQARNNIGLLRERRTCLKSVYQLACIAILHAAWLLNVGIAQASEVHLSGSSAGAFDLTAPGCSSTVGHLTFNCISFDVTTISGSTTFNAGSFSDTDTTLATYNSTFQLFLNFTSPLGIAGGTPTFHATVTGAYTLGLAGVVTIAFSDGTQSFNFFDGTNYGSFTVAFANQTNLTPGATAVLTATVSGASESPAPEPGTWLTLSTGVLCLGFVRLRRKL